MGPQQQPDTAEVERLVRRVQQGHGPPGPFQVRPRRRPALQTENAQVVPVKCGVSLHVLHCSCAEKLYFDDLRFNFIKIEVDEFLLDMEEQKKTLRCFDRIYFFFIVIIQIFYNCKNHSLSFILV